MKFSITCIDRQIYMYKATRDTFHVIHYHHYYNIMNDILCQTLLDDEITMYVWITPDNSSTHVVLQEMCQCDQRKYHVIDIHEDIPGIDHVGIIHRISGRFAEKAIPILYINTYGHNLVLVAEEYHTSAMEILREIAYV